MLWKSLSDDAKHPYRVAASLQAADRKAAMKATPGAYGTPKKCTKSTSQLSLKEQTLGSKSGPTKKPKTSPKMKQGKKNAKPSVHGPLRDDVSVRVPFPPIWSVANL